VVCVCSSTSLHPQQPCLSLCSHHSDVHPCITAGMPIMQNCSDATAVHHCSDVHQCSHFKCSKHASECSQNVEMRRGSVNVEWDLREKRCVAWVTNSWQCLFMYLQYLLAYLYYLYSVGYSYHLFLNQISTIIFYKFPCEFEAVSKLFSIKTIIMIWPSHYRLLLQ